MKLENFRKFPNGSYSVSDIQDYFGYVIKKHAKVTDNILMRKYLDKL